MNQDILIAIANAVLSATKGHGVWAKSHVRPKYEPIKDPLLGLSVGDKVFYYSEDGEQMMSDEVVQVVDGVGFVFENHHYYGPSLWPVSSEGCGQTIEEAVAKNRETIESDIEYCEGKASKLAALKSLLGQ